MRVFEGESGHRQVLASRFGWTAAVIALFLALRLPRLLELPIFSDEAIYLRYAQLIARHPFENAFVSLVDPKPPLHPWLLAMIFSLTTDPLLAGRLLSVLVGATTLLALLPLCQELERLAERRGNRLWRIALLLFAVCPFLGFYQRMALAEPLLVLEVVVVAWLALRMARRSSDRPFPALLRRDAAPLGVVLGLAFLTKQNTSYLMALLPAFAAGAAGVFASRTRARRWVAGFAVSIAIGVLLWSPVLFVDHGPGLRDRVFFRSQHAQLGSLRLHLSLARDALLYVFLPVQVAAARAPDHLAGLGPPADGGWFWLYLTPVVELAAVAGFVWMAMRRSVRPFVFLSGWTLSMLLPLFAARYALARYALAAVPPMLLSAAWLLTELGERLAGTFGIRRSATLPVALVAVTLAWPLVSTALSLSDWRRQLLVRSDRWQYVSGWPAGEATRQALAHLKSLSRGHRPIVVITNHLAGVPTDAVWVYLEGVPGVSVFFVEWMDRRPILGARGPSWFMLRSRFHHWVPGTMMVKIPDNVPVFFVSNDRYTGPGGVAVPAEQLLSPLNPSLSEVARYSNPQTDPDLAHSQVVLYRLQ